MKLQTLEKERLFEYNRLKREIEKRRGQVVSLNKCINHHSDKIITATSPGAIGKEGKMLTSRVDSKRCIIQELGDLEKQLKKLKI